MRRAAVAGQFYEGTREALLRRLESCFSGIARDEDEKVVGAVVPHAGYMYSGRVAAHAYARLPKADTFVILGPNHHLAGSAVAASRDTWSTPLGAVEVDVEFVDALPRHIIDVDETAHRYEHSIEVQLPFLQFIFGDFKFVPICMALSDAETANDVASEIVEAAAKLRRKIVVLASSDFTHYEPDNVARSNDLYAIDAITRLDVNDFYRRIYERNVSACGVGPIGAMLYATKALGAKSGELVKYATSGDITGDRSAVVGYAAILISR
ncbi:MAG TPA: MEMO1 family protein [Methanomicrobia archaeon]|mgnify:CR=1 FL=1|nr:MEMO1 family protein [Methanomicrobia archaeon]HEX58698.1 MEMO1 family protein [Methanomicrobia archaeon]